MDVAHTSAGGMIDWRALLKLKANVGILLSWMHFLRTGAAAGVLGAGRRDPNEGSFYANPAAPADRVSASLC